MADSTVVHIGENSPEQVAFKLMEKIASAESVVFTKNPAQGYTAADRKWILSTYYECYNVAKYGNEP